MPVFLHLRNITVSSVWANGSRPKPVNRLVSLDYIKTIDYDDNAKVIVLGYTNDMYERLAHPTGDHGRTLQLYNSLVTEIKKTDGNKVIEW